jgi:hypothetical protein
MKSNVDVVCKLTATAALLCMALAPAAKAGCRSSTVDMPFLDAKGLFAALQSQPLLAPQVGVPDVQEEGARNPSANKRHPVVGMWINDIYVGTNAQPSDHAIEQFSSDGNELINSGGFAPASENMCFGVWEASGPRRILLTHIGWDFDIPTGTFKGAVRLVAHITVSPDGDSFEGKYAQDELDPSGNVIPGSPVTGTMKGRRFKVVEKVADIIP